jgi:phosphoribosylformylglycinamidine synthase PurS subunit
MSQQYQCRIYVTLRPSVLDPAGTAVQSGLQQLGYSEVERVRVGKYIELTLTAADEETAKQDLDQMCDQLLVNTVIENYSFDVERLCLFLEQNQIQVSPINITEETVQQFIYSVSKEVNPRSQARIISGLKSFFSYLILEDYRTDNPMELIESPKTGRKLPDTSHQLRRCVSSDGRDQRQQNHPTTKRGRHISIRDNRQRRPFHRIQKNTARWQCL